MVRLIIEGKEYFGFTIDNLSLPYNTIASSFSFSGLDDYSPIPLQYPEVKIYNDDDLILTGYIVNQKYAASERPHLISVSGYSKSGILEDCTIPLSAMPMECDNMSLREICNKLLPLYNIKFTMEKVVLPLMNKKFEKVNFDYDKSIKTIIVNLAKERGVYVNHLTDGYVHFTDSSSDNLEVVEHFEDYGVKSMSLNVNGQSMHRYITVVAPADEEGVVNGEHTIENPYINVEKHIIKKLDDGSSMDVKEYARFSLGLELRSIYLKINTTKFVKSGQIISVKSDKLKIPKDTIFFIERTYAKTDPAGDYYELSCVLKDCYSKKPVKNVFI
ncbi:MAG: hypothetical protein PF486_06160 [Prolixibacteraceae bacterium]|jgi:prophage tail gpP-like protein|nr:hypothetical protein [Prolixibacteraceae bacterium]